MVINLDLKQIADEVVYGVTDPLENLIGARIAMPLVRRVFAPLIANEIVSVQPMNMPAGNLFYLDFEHENNDRRTPEVLPPPEAIDIPVDNNNNDDALYEAKYGGSIREFIESNRPQNQEEITQRLVALWNQSGLLEGLTPRRWRL